jgi:hypothetical protein
MMAAKGHFPKTSFTVMEGVVGTGTCGTSSTDAMHCAITAEDITTGSTLIAKANITLKPPGLPT